MNLAKPIALETEYPDHEVLKQLKKIFRFRVFAVSKIMKRFLSFVVQETLAGRSHTIKEYTIAVQVLDKPLSFNPQMNAIVRIHAGRLRRALNLYYLKAGAMDPIHIQLRSGSYIPCFSNDGTELPEDTKPKNIELSKVPSSTILAVIPFMHFEKSASRAAFIDGLGMQISSELTHFKATSVISYYSMHKLSATIGALKDIASEVGAEFIITGNVQFRKERVRININLIDANSQEQSWSEMYDRKLNILNAFEIQDEIVRDAVSKITDYLNLAN